VGLRLPNSDQGYPTYAVPSLQQILGDPGFHWVDPALAPENAPDVPPSSPSQAAQPSSASAAPPNWQLGQLSPAENLQLYDAIEDSVLNDAMQQAVEVEMPVTPMTVAASFTEVPFYFPPEAGDIFTLTPYYDTGSSILNFAFNSTIGTLSNLSAAALNLPLEVLSAIPKVIDAGAAASHVDPNSILEGTPLFEAEAGLEALPALAQEVRVLPATVAELGEALRVLAADERGALRLTPRAASNAYKAIVGVERTYLEVTEISGVRSLGRELRFDVLLSDEETVRVRLDELFQDADGRLFNAESKFGRWAGFTPNEVASGVPQEFTFWAVPDDASALRAGLEPGVPVQITSRVHKWLWDL